VPAAGGPAAPATTEQPAAADKLVLTEWPRQPEVTAIGPVISCNEVNEHDLLAFYVAGLTADTHLPTRSVGYLYRNLRNNAETRRIFVDTDVMPEVFVAVPEALRSVETAAAIPPAALVPDPPPPAPIPAPSEKPAPPPAGDPVPSATPMPVPGEKPLTPPAPEIIPASPPVAPTAVALPAELNNPAPAASVLEGPVVSNVRLPGSTSMPASTTAGLGADGAESEPVLTQQPVWGFGRIESGSPDRRDRLAALEISGKTARIRTISSDKIQITGSSFVLTAVPAKNCVHIFWRQVPERSLPSRVINHVVYDGKDFTQEPGLQEGVPVGFFATTLLDDKILMTVLKPASPDAPTAESGFAGKYSLQYALLDAEPTRGSGTGLPPVLQWETATDVSPVESLYELVPVERLDGKVQRLLLHGESEGVEKIIAVTVPPRDQLSGPWANRTFMDATQAGFPNPDRYTLISLAAMLAVFSTIFLIAWLRPWRFFEKPPEAP
jgi:hypothetical protein